MRGDKVLVARTAGGCRVLCGGGQGGQGEGRADKEFHGCVRSLQVRVEGAVVAGQFSRSKRELLVAEGEDGRTKFLGFLRADACDGLELREGARAGKHDGAQGGGGEDEELGQAEPLGF